MAAEFGSMSKQNQWAIIGGLCAVIVGVFYWYIWSPNAAIVTSRTNEINQMVLDNQRTMAIAGQLEQLEQDVSTMEGQFATLANILPEEQQTDELLRRLQTAAADTDLELRRFDNQPPVLHDLYAEVPIQLDLVGGFHDLARFFDRVSKFGRIVTVGRVSITGLTDGSGNTIQSVCTASTFFFLPESEATAAEEAAPAAGRGARRGR